jgi:N-acetylglucosamine-6-phosphate deacetylase
MGVFPPPRGGVAMSGSTSRGGQMTPPTSIISRSDLHLLGPAFRLSSDPLDTTEGVCTIAAAHRQSGTTGLLPTLMTDSHEKVRLALHTASALVGREPSVLGIHLEGPYLSPEKPGVHDARHIRRPAADDISMLTAPRNGVLLLTLAPEVVPPGFIAQLVAAGVRVSLGHSMASYRQTRAAMAEGLRGFTHLFNAMRPLASREPGPIAQALESTHAWYGLIVDGVHVDPAMLRLALRGLGRPLLVTDAMPPVGGSQSSFTLHGRDITVRDGCCLTDDGTLAGTVLDMAPSRTAFACWGCLCRTRVLRRQIRRRLSVSNICSAGSSPNIAPTWWASIQTI